MENENQASVVSSEGKLPGVFALLDETSTIYKSKLKLFISIAIVPQLIMLLLTFIIYLGGIPEFSPNGLFLKVILGILGILVVLLFLFFVVWSTTALLYAAKEKGNTNFKESYKKSLPYLVPVFVVSFLSGLISLGGFLLFIIPGVIFSVWFSFISYIIINEDIKGFNALLKSREYVKGRWWGVFGRFLAFGALMAIVYIVIIAFMAVIRFVFPGIGGILEQIFGVFINAVIAPLQIIFGFVLYEKIKNIKGDFEFSPSRKKKAFSIVSFIVVAILGIFSVILFISFAGSLFSGGSFQDIKKNADLIVIQDALNNYHNDKGVYPESLDKLFGNYLISIPTDSSTGKSYEYILEKDDDNFQICANLRKEVRCLGAFTE